MSKTLGAKQVVGGIELKNAKIFFKHCNAYLNQE